MKSFEITCTSEKFGAVRFDVVGDIASQQDRTGEWFSPTRTFDDSVKWVLDQISRMRKEAPDLRFVK